MRRRARVDANHSQIVETLRTVGARVRSLASAGKGIPDLLVGFRGKFYLLEVKDGSKPPSARKLTDDEDEFYREFKPVCPDLLHIVTNEEQALRAIGVLNGSL